MIFQKNRGEIFCVTTSEAHSMMVGGINGCDARLAVILCKNAWVVCLFKQFLSEIVKKAVEEAAGIGVG